MDLNAWLDTELPRFLPGYLPQCRWFGGKARPIRAAEFEDAVWLPESPRPCALVVVRVHYGDGARERYAMLLTFGDEQQGLPVVGRLNESGAAMCAAEAGTDAGAAVALLRGFASPRELPTLRGGIVRYGDIGEAAGRLLEERQDRVAIRPVGVEQSNTSLRIDRSLVFKLFRKLDAGENPELEVSRYLTTRTAFRAMPVLQGSVSYVSPRGDTSTLGVLQDWVENTGDGWSHVVAQLRAQASDTNGAEPARDLFVLGATTADFHGALAGDAQVPAFTPEPVTAADVQAWHAALLDRVTQTFALVERSIEQWRGTARQLGGLLLDLRERVGTTGRPPEPVASAGFQKIRIHGDYHLGQTLKTADGFVLIDFEGEPARPLAERRLKGSALKDVAGMIRSFDYAVETVQQDRPHEHHAGLSAQRLREAFLDGYFSSTAQHGAPYLPDDRRALDAWIDFFELEKALYELEYEINNRPAWVHIPLRGVLRIVGA